MYIKEEVREDGCMDTLDDVHQRGAQPVRGAPTR
jgi:hypothetical protein